MKTDALKKYGSMVGFVGSIASILGLLLFFMPNKSKVELALLSKNEQLIKIESELKLKCAQLEKDLEKCGGSLSKEITNAAKYVIKKSTNYMPIAQAALLLGQYDEAIKWYKLEVEKGSEIAIAQNNIGVIYSMAKKDYAFAIYWFEKAAEKGNVIAQNNLSDLYLNGNGVEKDYKKGLQWLIMAVEQGDAIAIGRLGALYFNGWGVEVDYNLAFKYFKIAAEKGDATSQNSLGGMYYKRGIHEGDNQLLKDAVKWYTKAAKQGESNAQYNLAKMLYEGVGGKKNKKEAYKWLQRASQNGHEKSKEALKKLEF